MEIVRFTTRIPKDLVEKLKILAVKKNVSVSKILIEILEKQLK